MAAENQAEKALIQRKIEEITRTVREQHEASLRKEQGLLEIIEKLREEKELLKRNMEILKKRFENEINILTAQTRECVKISQLDNKTLQNSFDFLSASIDERYFKGGIRRDSTDDLRVENEKLVKTLMNAKLKFIEERTNMLGKLKMAEEEMMDYKMKYAQVALDKDYFIIKYQNLAKELQRKNVKVNQ